MATAAAAANRQPPLLQGQGKGLLGVFDFQGIELMIEALEPGAPGVHQNLEIPVDHRAVAPGFAPWVAEIQLVALPRHGVATSDSSRALLSQW